MNTPEKLNLWDRLFNRHRREVIARGSEKWCHRFHGLELPNSDYPRDWVEYKITDRLTGSERIEREYIA